MLVVTDVIVIIYVDTDIIGKCYCHVVLMTDSLCHCDTLYSHFLSLWLMETTLEIIDNVVTVTDGKSHVHG